MVGALGNRSNRLKPSQTAVAQFIGVALVGFQGRGCAMAYNLTFVTLSSFHVAYLLMLR